MPSLNESLEQLLNEHFPASEENLKKFADKTITSILTKKKVKAMLVEAIEKTVEHHVKYVLSCRVPNDLVRQVVDEIIERGLEEKEDLNAPYADDITTVIEFYQTYHPLSKPGDVQKNKIRMRLKDGYTANDLCDAIRGMHLTPHNQGHNDAKTKYLGLELAIRSSDHVQRFMEAAKNPPAMPTDETFDSVFGNDI